jgi:hypothetical protein
MRKTFFILMVLLLVFPALVFGANVTKVSGVRGGSRAIQITGLDADWYLTNDGVSAGLSQAEVNQGVFVEYIIMVPSAANDRFVFRNSAGGDDGQAAFLDTGAIQDAEARIYVPPDEKKLWPFLDISACTLDTAANAKVIIGIK